jgi:GNAT superfamily N-acetyltransferase
MSNRIRVVTQKQLEGTLGRTLRKALCRCFPSDRKVFSKTLAWHGSAPAWGVVIEKSRHIVAHVGVVDRVVRAGHTPIRIAGIQNVFVLPEYRGQGLSQQAMNKAMKEALRRQFDCGLLFCIPAIAKVYTVCGWQILGPRKVTRTDENGTALPLPGKNIAMFYPLKRKGFPRGPIHLQGNDW